MRRRSLYDQHLRQYPAHLRHLRFRERDFWRVPAEPTHRDGANLLGDDQPAPTRTRCSQSRRSTVVNGSTLISWAAVRSR
jgi:hypothetical protein